MHLDRERAKVLGSYQTPKRLLASRIPPPYFCRKRTSSAPIRFREEASNGFPVSMVLRRQMEKLGKEGTL